MKKTTKYLTEGQFRHLIRKKILLELRKIENTSPMRLIDDAYTPDKKCLKFDSPQEALDFINNNWNVGDVMSISHALFFGQGNNNIYAWRREVEDSNINQRGFAPYRNGFVKIVDNETLLTFLRWILHKYGDLSLFTHNGPDDLRYFNY